MYTVSVQRDFVAQHYLIGGDWGPENQLHSHHYVVELQLHGSELDQHGYLVDIVEIENHMAEMVAQYRDQTLNDQEPFAGLNPSIEHFSRILCQWFAGVIDAPNVKRFVVKIWENDIAWASYQVDKG